MQALERIRAKLAEAKGVAEEAGIRPDPLGPTAGDQAAPATVVPLIEVALNQTEAVIWSQRRRMGLEE